MIQLIVYDQFTDTPIILDTSNDEYIKINKSMFSIDDLSSRSSEFSQSFRLPFSDTNNKYFQNVRNIESFNPTGFNKYVSLRCDIVANGSALIRGYMRLNNTYHVSQEYEVEVYTEVGNIVSALSDKKLTDLDLSAYDHSLTYANITNSWAGSLFSGDVVYPLVDWGNNWQGSADLQSNSVGAKVYDFRPSINVKALLELILNEAGYTADSSSVFWSSDFFTKQYLLLGTEVSKLPTPVYTMIATKGSDQGLTNSFAKITFAATVNEGGLFTDSTDRFTAPKYGSYSFNVVLIAQASSAPYADNFFFEYYVNGVASGTPIVGDGGSTPTDNTFNFTVTLDGGDYVEIYAKEDGTDVSILTDSTWTLTSYPKNAAGSLISLSGLMPQIKQIDFLKTIINNNNLIIRPNDLDPSILLIESYNEYLSSGSVVDWTTKIDLNKDLVSTPLYNIRKKDIIYMHLSDSDVINASFESSNGRVFGEYKVLDDSPMSNDGQQSNYTVCSPYTISRISGSDILIHLAFVINPDGTVTVPKMKPKIAIFEMMRPSENWYFESSDTDGTKNVQTEYPYFSEYFDLDVNGKTTSSSLVHNWLVDTPSSSSYVFSTIPDSTNSLFEVNYRYQLDQVYADEGLSVTAYFYLNEKDFRDIEANDIIVVKNNRFRLMSIDAYTVGLQQAVKCTLQKIITED